MAAKKFRFGDNTWLDSTPYRVVRAIGRGGMGEVYEVDHTKTGTRRALKVLRDSVSSNSNSARRFEREAFVLQRLSHPNLVKVYEFGHLTDGIPFFAMELLQGVSLRKILTKIGPIEFTQAVDIAVQVLDGLAAVHRHGLVHRDLKPGNIMVEPDGRVVLLDFGVAGYWQNNSAHLTRTGAIIGTTHYMSPEQLQGLQADARSDVYSMGLILFEMLVGLRPFDGATRTGGSVFDRLNQTAPRLGLWTSDPALPAVRAAIDRALSRKPADRYPHAGAFAKALRLAMGPRAPVPWKSRRVEPSNPRVSIVTPASQRETLIPDAAARVTALSDACPTPSLENRLVGRAFGERDTFMFGAGFASAAYLLLLSLGTLMLWGVFR